MDRIKVIANPYSGRGRGGQVRERIATALTQAGVEYDFAETGGPGHAIELARSARLEGYDVIAAAGGDGTVSEVMNGIAQATPADQTVGKLAFLPTGSANDFTDELAYPRDLDAAARIIALGRTRRVDLGYVEVEGGAASRYFNNNMGLGLEARVTMESYKIKRLQGSLLYAVAALRTLPQYQAPHLNLVCQQSDGQPWNRSGATLLVTIGNTRRTGGGFYLTPDALLDDGFFDVGVVGDIPLWKILVLFPKAMYGRHTTDSAVTMLRCRQIQVKCEAGLPVQLDGEILSEAAHEVEVQVETRRLEIVV